MLKKKSSSQREDLIGSMNDSWIEPAPIWSRGRGSEQLHETEGFYGQKEGGTRKLKEWIISGEVIFLKAAGFISQITDYLTSPDRESLDWLF